MTLTDLSRHAESVEQFIRDLATAFREKRWVKILSLAGVAVALFLNPYGFGVVGIPKPGWYSYGVWGAIVASFFVRAFLIALLTKQKEKTDLPPATSIIKGLLAYTNTKEDADWFARLQRGNVLHDCLRFCLGTGSSFAILTGESGTGKTSFLQAGLSPRLEAQGLRAVCVKLTDSPPMNSICESLNSHVEQLTSQPLSLLTVLRDAVRDDARPTVLILDQFEQFFTRNKSKAARKAFIEQMTEWHKVCDSLPVKILISIRDDFADQLSDFQKSMDYTLTAHNKLRLEKFEPQEAAQVIGVIAREAKIELDEAFVKELTRHELADREEGTVSPVDIQILSWMLDAQKTSEERAFNRRAFQKLGGVEGLLERFLSRQLDARDTEARRQTVIKVMLALTDQNVRAGALSLKALKEKLGGVVSEREVEEAVSWLARSDVRLVTQIQEKSDTLYELAHERIIAPLRRLAFKEISSVEKAQQTLDRRVNEWIGNNRARRYLLTFREWWLIRRNWPLIRLDSQKEQKHEFVSRSKGRFVLGGALLSVAVVLGFAGYWGYAWYEARPQTQINRAEKHLIALLNENKDTKAMEYASLLLAVLDAQKDPKLSHDLWEQIKRRDGSDRAKVLARLGQAYVKVSKPDEALKVLADAQHEGSTLDSSAQQDILDSLAASYAELSTLARTFDALKGLEGIQERTRKLDGLFWRLYSLDGVAEAYADLLRCDLASNVWDGALHGLEKEEAYEKPSRLRSWFEMYGRLRRRCGDHFASNGLKIFHREMAGLPADERRKLKDSVSYYLTLPTSSSINLQKANETKQANRKLSPAEEVFKLLDSADEIKSAKPDDALRILEQVSSSAENLALEDQSSVLFGVTRFYVELARTEEALRILNKIRVLAEANPSLGDGKILWIVALEYCKQAKVDPALELMTKADAVGKVDRFTLMEFIAVLTELSTIEEAKKGLNEVGKLIETLPQSEQVDLFLLMAQVYGKLKQSDEAGNSLVRAQKAATAKSSEEKSSALTEIAAGYARLGKWPEAVELAQSIGNEVDAISALVRILIISKEFRDSTKYSEGLERVFERIDLGI
jgi:hypothetical protein